MKLTGAKPKVGNLVGNMKYKIAFLFIPVKFLKNIDRIAKFTIKYIYKKRKVYKNTTNCFYIKQGEEYEYNSMER